MTRRRRLFLIVVVLVLVSSVTTPALLYVRQSPLERAYHRLRLGMTVGEVSDVIGQQPTELGSKQGIRWKTVAHTGLPLWALAFQDNTPEFWSQDEQMVVIAFDRAGKSIYHELRLDPPPPPTLFERLRAWLGW